MLWIDVVLSSSKNGFHLEMFFLLPKLFWPTVRRNHFSDQEKNLEFEAKGWEFAKILRPLEQFVRTWKVRTVFGNRMLF